MPPAALDAQLDTREAVLRVWFREFRLGAYQGLGVSGLAVEGRRGIRRHTQSGLGVLGFGLRAAYVAFALGSWAR